MRRPLLATVLGTSGVCLGLILAWLPVGRWWQLQRLGEVPEAASFSTGEGIRDWHIAFCTTWWGKRLDPQRFWQNRTIWNDNAAQLAARRHGRCYPPIPNHLPNLAAPFSRPAKDLVAGLTGPDSGPYIPYHFSEAETVYWDWFAKTHPRPPEELEREQRELARRIFEGRKPLIAQGRELRVISAKERVSLEASEKSYLRQSGFPAEALTEEALFWAYVLAQRQEYERISNAGWRSGSVPVINLLGRLGVDSRFVTEPLTPSQWQEAKAWRIAYLQRLRRENTTNSYITAYLKAWNLFESEVVHEDQHQ